MARLFKCPAAVSNISIRRSDIAPLRLMAITVLAIGFAGLSILRAQPVIELDAGTTRFELGTQVDILEDPTRQLTLADVRSEAYDTLFKRSDRGILNFGYSPSDHWVRLRLKTTTASLGENWILEVGNSFLEKIQFYWIRPDGEIIYKETGRDIPFDKREVPGRVFLFWLPESTDEVITLYLRLSGDDNKMLDVVIWGRASYADNLRQGDVILALYFGIIFALAAYNLFLFFSLRERSYLYYVLFITSTAFTQLHVTVWGPEYLDLHLIFSGRAYIIYQTSAVVFAMLFSMRFLNLKQYYPVIQKVLIGLLVLLVIETVFGLHKPFYPLALKASSVLMVVTTIVLVTAGALIARKGYRPARYFLVGWSVLLVAVLVMQTKHLGYLPVTPFTRYALKFASAFEAIIFSLGLADRFHTTAMQLKMKTLETQKLAESEKMKSDFFSNITHEFRTPLMLIIGHIRHLLKESKLSPNDVARLKVAERNTNHLSRLITQLLDISRLDAGMLKVTKRAFNANLFFRLIIGTFNSVADHRRLSFKAEIDLPSRKIVTDEDKLEKIVYNLLSNAFKFTHEGGVSLQVSTDGDATLIIEVRDSGVGVELKDIQRIFERFYQVTPDMAGSSGSGIGLALTKELVSLLGGTIHVKSTAGKGTDFKVVIPIVVTGEAEEDVTIHDMEPEPRMSKAIPDRIVELDLSDSATTILVVEDNEDLRQYICDGLRGQCSIITAVNGREGLTSAQTEMPDIVVTDWMMPDMDGIELCAALKSDPLTSHIPVIMITAKADMESKLKGLQTGADDYIYKPFDFEELGLKITNRLATQKTLQEKLRKDLLSEPSPLQGVFSEDEKFLFAFKEAVEKNLSDPQLSVDMLRKELGVSRVQLSRKINAMLGIPINDYVRLTRLKRAADLLSRNWGPVSQVAYEVGFNNLSYFSKCFREQYGKSPSEYVEN